MTSPRDPIAAVTHPNPYPYYADLASSAPLARDESLGTWVAASAEAALAVLASDACAVRPPAEPVPAGLVGSAAGELFGRFVRMRDGETHRDMKRAALAKVAAIDRGRVEDACAEEGGALSRGLGPDADPRRVTAFAFAFPVHVMASVLGVARKDRAATAACVEDFVACLAPAAGRERVERGERAALQLLEAFRAARVDDVAAGAIGFLVQTYEATAGLIGNALLALGRDADLGARIATDPARIGALVADVLRDDPPVQNTRRIVVRSAVIAGREMREGDAVLVVLAAAARDPAAGSLSFGAGAHACPGASLATAIAEAGVRQLLASGVDPARCIAAWTYRPSINLRIPLFGDAEVAS